MISVGGASAPTRSWLKTLLPLSLLLLAACSDGGRNLPEDIGEPVDVAGPGTFTKFRYAVDPHPHRDYYVYVPSDLPLQPVPLVVYLHGCQQTATDAALGVRWNEAADAHKFVVVYPDQALFDDDDPAALDGNGGHCWNWFLPQHQARGSGEPATIAGITGEVMERYQIDADRVYVTGISAGGAMTGVMGATYPDLYAAIGVVAGAAYQGDSSGEAAAQAMGEQARVMPVINIQGTADAVVLFPVGVGVTQQWLGTNDRVDDGAANNSVSPQPAAIDNHGVDASMLANIGAIGDLCITPPAAVPCVGAALGLDEYPRTVAHYVDAQGQPLIDFWIVHGMGHAYIGGSREGTFTDPIGPNITEAIYEFFMSHPRMRP